MLEEDKKKPLVVPDNCPPVSYPFVNGFTGTDMGYVGIISAIALIVAIIIYAQRQNIFVALALLILFVSAAIMIFGRDKYGENIIDKIRILRKYAAEKKHFLYEYVNIYDR